MPLRPNPTLARFELLRKLGRNRPLGYAVAVLAVAAATLVRFTFGDALGSGSLITFYPAVIVATLCGRFRAGALATILAILAADYFFLAPPFSFAMSGAGPLALALFGAILISFVVVISVLFEAIDVLFGEAEKLRLIFESGPMGIVTVDDTGAITMVNAAAERQFGYDRKELVGKTIEVLVPEELRGGHAKDRGQYGRSPSVRKMGAGRDLSGLRSDGTKLPVEIGLNPIEREGRRGTLATVLDVSERKEAERKQTILTHEVEHRARNILTLVQAVASRILVADRPMAETRKKFFGVLQALSRTLSMMGGGDRLLLQEIVESELKAFREQVMISGCEIALSRSAAQTFSLIVHELATNALKHGALARGDGHVDVEWRREDGFLVFAWMEKSDRPVVTPIGKGFGRVILEDLARDIGVATIRYEGGYRYLLRARWERVVAPPAEMSVTAA